MTSRRGRVSIGIAGALGADAARIIAPAVERAGFHALWVNDTPGADSLEVLAAAAAVTDSLVLATGVIPLDRRPASEVAAAVVRHGLPTDRLVVGVGAGSARVGALALMEEGVGALRDRLDARVYVGALGPRMRRLAADHADGVLLSWLSPVAVAEQAREVAGADVTLYVRTALDPAGVIRRDEEAARYAGFPAYAANFARLGLDPLDTMLPLPGDESIRPGVAAYRSAVDEVVLRAVTATDTVEEYLRFIDHARGVIELAAPSRPAAG